MLEKLSHECNIKYMTTLNNEQKVTLTVSPQTAHGKPASITGVPLWSSSDVNVLSLVVSADGLSATAVGGAAGQATVSVIANAGTEAAPVQINGSIDITVTSAPAATLVITASTVVDQ